MIRFVVILYIINSVSVHAETWNVFYKYIKNSQGEQERMLGFKNKKGAVKIEPIINDFVKVKKFDDIMAVLVDVNNTGWTPYYLTKGGKKVGKDMMWMSDWTFDCESEGFIRFRDTKTGYGGVGMFDKNGNVAIKPKYQRLSRVHNGMVVALHDAKEERSDDNIFYSGGAKELLTARGDILIKDFDDKDIDLYSLKIAQKISTDNEHKSYLGANGKYYIFEVYEKAFMAWIKKDIFSNLTNENILKHTYKNSAKIDIPKVIRVFNDIKNQKIEYSMKNSILNVSSGNYQEFEDNCGSYEDGKYPSFTFNIKNRQGHNNYITFVKTGDSYQLLEANLD